MKNGKKNNRSASLETTKLILGKNFIGPKEIKKIYGISFSSSPKITFGIEHLNKISKDYILILGTPRIQNGQKLTLNRMREIFGWDPAVKEPCFYNQDWYLKEDFANKTTLENRWYLIKKTVESSSRGKTPDDISKSLPRKNIFPSAILTAYVFFAYYILTNKILWQHDFIWCSDTDHNGDRIYTGRYLDPNKTNKNGFNIHRHLSLCPCYGLVPQLKG